MKTSIKLLALALAALLPSAAFARPVTIPAGTVVYGQLDERVISRKKDYVEGEFVRAHVWRDVVVSGRLVIRAGDPMLVRISRLKKANIAGGKGELELQAVTVLCPNGAEVPLSGGYDKSGRAKKALSISLAAVVAWPLDFIKGKQAVLDVGTVFDATVQANTTIQSINQAPRRIQAARGFEVDVLYEEMDPEGKSRALPVTLRKCRGAVAPAAVVTVNEQKVAVIPVTLEPAHIIDGCAETGGQIDLNQLAKHFTLGINRFEVEVDGSRAEVILDIEM